MLSIQPENIRRKMGKSCFSKNIIFYKTLDSTSGVAKALACSGAPEGTLVLTEEQTAGKGRLGRCWFSPAYSNLLFSLLLRPKMKVENVFGLTMAFALATVEAVEEASHLSPKIKWPNDVYLYGKKLGGILTEFSVMDSFVEYVILGLGLNVSWSPEDDGPVLYETTNIMAESGRRIDREHLLVQLLKRMENYYQDVLMGKMDVFYEKWNARSMLLKKHVEVETVNGKITGEALRIDRKGALVIMGESGKEQRILNGDVSVRKQG